MSSATSPPSGETRLGPFFFTFRPHPGSEAITVPGFIVPFQWPPPAHSNSTSYSSFVYTDFAPSPVQPVWSVDASSVAQWTGHPPPTPEPSPSTAAQPLPSTSGPSLQPPTPAATVTPATNTTLLPPFSQAEQTRKGAASTQHSSPRRALNSTNNVETCSATTMQTTIPAISITKGTDSSHSFSPPPLSAAKPELNVAAMATPPRFPAKSTTLSSASESSSNRLGSPDFSVPLRKNQRKSLPGEWTKMDARPKTPITVVDVDEASLSPTRERPLSAASTYQSPAPSLRRRPTMLLRENRPVSCSPSLAQGDLKASSLPSVLRAKSMGHLRISSSDQREVTRLLNVEPRPAPSPVASSSALQDVTNTLPSRLKAPERMNGSPDQDDEEEYVRPPTSRRYYNLSSIANTPDSTAPASPSGPSGLQPESSKSAKNIDEAAEEEWNAGSITSLTYKTAHASSSTPSPFPTAPSQISNLVADRSGAHLDPESSYSSSVTQSSLASYPSDSSSLVVEATRSVIDLSSLPPVAARRASNVRNAGQEVGDMQEAVATLADMLEETLVITEYIDGQVGDPRASDVEEEVLEDVTLSPVAVGLNSPSSNGDEDSDDGVYGQSERAFLLASGSPTPRGTPSWRGSPPCLRPRERGRSSQSLNWLDVDSSFSAPRSTSYAPAPDGYIHIDETTLTSVWSEDADETEDTETSDGSEVRLVPIAESIVEDDDDAPADVEFSVESVPSSLRSPISPPSVRRFPYDYGGTLPTIPEIDEYDSPIQSRYWARRPRQASLSSSVYSN